MTNAVKHGPAGRVDIDLRGSDGALELVVTDNGENALDPAQFRPGRACASWPIARATSARISRSSAVRAGTGSRSAAPCRPPDRPRSSRAMKFGIFFELSVPRPFSPEREREVIVNALEQARVADALGFECAWVVEHHFLEEYSHSSAPELFLTAVAMQTQRIRVGHGAVVCVPEIDHPIRVAERAAFLDLLSGGRLEFGTARSSTWTEIGGFEADPDDTKKDWDEYVRVLPKMWMQETFAHRGRCFSMPERAVLPKPLQKPHPPIWVTVTSPGTELDAADRGIGCLGVATASYAEQERRTREYHRRIQLCDPVGAAVNDRVAILNFLYCHEDARRRSRAGPALPRHLRALERAPPVHARGLPDVAPTNRSRTSRPRRRRRAGRAIARACPTGSASAIRTGIISAAKRWESIGVDQINLLLNALRGAHPGPGAREPAPVRERGDAGVRVVSWNRRPGGLARGAATLASFATAPEKLLGVETLQIAFEVVRAGADELLPPGLHPTRPPVVTWLVQRVPESPWGPFALAQCRIECRSGLRPRGFLRGGLIDNEAARAALAARWGYALALGEAAPRARLRRDPRARRGRGRRRARARAARPDAAAQRRRLLRGERAPRAHAARAAPRAGGSRLRRGARRARAPARRPFRRRGLALRGIAAERAGLRVEQHRRRDAAGAALRVPARDSRVPRHRARRRLHFANQIGSNHRARPCAAAPRGNARSIRRTSSSLSESSIAPAFSSACSARAAFGIANTCGSRTRKRSAICTRRPPCTSAIARSARAAGKLARAERAVGHHGDAVLGAEWDHLVSIARSRRW